MRRRMLQRIAVMTVGLAAPTAVAILALPSLGADRAERAVWGRSPISEPYSYVGAGSFSGPTVPESPDPPVAYRWPNPHADDALEIYPFKPKAVSADKPESFDDRQHQGCLSNRRACCLERFGPAQFDE